MAQHRSWYVLQHSSGPAVPAGSSVFSHPDIAEHYAFLERRRDDGSLVAAGPLSDVDGDGFTVLDLPSIDEAERLARTDDRSVLQGVLQVRVRPWAVVMAPRFDL